MHIGELARRSGRSVHAIRWYETQGLMPGVLRDSGGRRLYHERHVGWLEVIDRLRHSGMSIASLRDYTALAVQGGRTVKPTLEMLIAHRERVHDTIAEWDLALKLIDGKIDFYRQWQASGRRPEPEGAAKHVATLPMRPGNKTPRKPPRKSA
jgi:DNA-binding transcriptional MerR regulator